METSSLFLKDPSAVTLVAGDLEAVFLPGYGMLGASLRHRHIEILRRVQDLEVAAGFQDDDRFIHNFRKRHFIRHFRCSVDVFSAQR
jgi:hypothetical protein